MGSDEKDLASARAHTFTDSRTGNNLLHFRNINYESLRELFKTSRTRDPLFVPSLFYTCNATNMGVVQPERKIILVITEIKNEMEFCTGEVSVSLFVRPMKTLCLRAHKV